MIEIILLVAGLFLLFLLFPGLGNTKNKSTEKEKADPEMEIIVVDDEQIWIEK